MTDPQIAIMMLGLFIVIVMLGFPIAFTLVAMGLGFGYCAYYDPLCMSLMFDNRIFDLFVQNTLNDVLVAVLLFLFMGYVVEWANIVNRLFFSIQLAARNLAPTQGSRVFNGQNIGDGVLAVCRVLDLCFGLFLSRRP